MSKSKKMRDHATDLADRLAPHVESAREMAGPMIADAKDKAGPIVAEARSKAAPAMAAAVAAASDASKEARGEAKKRGRATVAALKGEVDAPKKKHRKRKLVALMGLAGIGGLIAKHFSDRQATTAWQSSYKPTPTTPPASPARRFADETPMGTASAAAAAAAPSDDEGAAAPDEAAADAEETPHAATTPDNPAEVIEVDKKKH